MPKKKNIEKKVDKIQDKIEKIELRRIQEGYKTKTPFLIWLLETLVLISIILTITNIIPNRSNPFLIIKGVFFVITYSILFYGILKRKRWSLYLWLILMLINIISALMEGTFYYLPIQLVIIVLIYWHKNYLNK